MSATEAFVRNWLPLLAWCSLIVVESTDMMSGQHTGHWLYVFLNRYLQLGLSDQFVYGAVNLALRKAGHVFGYAMMSLLFFRAYRNHQRWRHGLSLNSIWRDGLDWCWRAQWAVFGVLFTLLVATADELHQMTIPSRTGTWHDIVLDTSGAIVAQFLLRKWIARRHEAAAS
jgi:VanZ family protein